MKLHTTTTIQTNIIGKIPSKEIPKLIVVHGDDFQKDLITFNNSPTNFHIHELEKKTNTQTSPQPCGLKEMFDLDLVCIIVFSSPKMFHKVILKIIMGNYIFNLIGSLVAIFKKNSHLKCETLY
jgi:hypothetical protein